MSSNPVKSAAIEEAEKWIGRETTYDGVDEVSRNDIRRKLEVYCFDCPIYTDDASARAHGYQMAIAPGAMIPLWSLPAYWSPGDPPIFGPGLAEKDGSVNSAMPNRWKNGLNASSEIEFFEPAYPGDRLRTTSKLVEVKPRKTHLGEGVFLISELAMTKQTGEKVAVRRNASFRYDVDAEAKPAENGKPSDEAVTDVSTASPYNEPIDWSKQLRFADVQVGDDLPTFNLWLSYQRIVMSIAVDRMFSGIHHNRDFARAGGLDDIIFNTRGYDMTMELTLRRWIGLDGRIVKIGPFRMRKAGHPGDTLVCGGRVTKLEKTDRGGRVSLAIWVDSSRGRGTLGEATVALP
jgi:3-methylfumaryl-CoA hydratase